MKNLRILHVLSPVKWNNDTFNSSADSNWKVCEKTINFLPNCHHYVLVPLSHDIKLNDRENVSFIRYNYPKSVQINRGIFDYRQVKFDFKKIDIDFVFTHQPELTFNIQQWFHTNRYYEDVAYFGFYHWIDCNASRGSTSGCPSFYMRQLESMHILDANFIHSDVSLEYFKSNFKEADCTSLIKDIYYMPLSSKLEVEPTPFDLPKKKILLFNHRWNKSSGIEKLVEFTKDLSDEYLIWVTDESCDIKDPKFMVKHLKYSDYVHLVNNCYASLCFISGYSTWNLSAQDSLLAGIPLLYFKHKTIELVVGNKNLGSFKTKEDFYHLLENLPQVDKDILYEHDFLFELQLKSAMNKYWYDTKNVPSNTEKWIDCIKNNITDKQSIVRKVYGNDWGTSSAHFIRRHLLNNGVLDDTNKPYSDYSIEGEERIIKRDLFNQL
jgi:hypothetical protein